MLFLLSSGRFSIFGSSSSLQLFFNVFDGLLNDSLLKTWSGIGMYAFGREDFLAVSRVDEETNKAQHNNKGGGHLAIPRPLRRHPIPIGMPLTHSAIELFFHEAVIVIFDATA